MSAVLPSTKCASAARTAQAVAIGIMAYNEEKNIGALLDSLLTQTYDSHISRIVVIASGCTDDTCRIVKRYMARDQRIELVAEGDRAGKIAAINTFMAMVEEPLIVVSCGDLIFTADTVERLCEPLFEPAIGMTGAHPVPVNDPKQFVGFAVNLMWRLHDIVARRNPKMGELVAVKNVLKPLSTLALCDELSIEHQIRSAGLQVVYAADAVVYNQGPQTLREFFRQRCRWIAANYQVSADYHLVASTLNLRLLLRATWEYVREAKPRFDWLVGVAALEAAARLKAFLDYHIFKSRAKYRVWKPVASTKEVFRLDS